MKAARQAGVLCEVSELMHLKREGERASKATSLRTAGRS